MHAFLLVKDYNYIKAEPKFHSSRRNLSENES